MQQAPRVLVISPQKTGTHLLQGLFGMLGYKMAGVPRPEPSNIPRFTDEQKLRIASLILSEPDHKELVALRGTPEFERLTGDAWAALSWSWQRRLGQRIVNRYGQASFEFADRVITNEHHLYTRFADTPARLCWIYHELDLDQVDGAFLGEWVETGAPPIVFNYRDPRDRLVSMINFVEGRTRQGYGNFYEYDIYHAILTSKQSWEAKIDYALRDPSFMGRQEYEKSLWLLNHPAVCKVSFEELIGPRGGGTRAAQVRALGRIFEHIRFSADPEKVVDKVYNPQSWSFFRGRVGGWREVFSDSNLRYFRDQHGDTLQQYGYE